MGYREWRKGEKSGKGEKGKIISDFGL